MLWTSLLRDEAAAFWASQGGLDVRDEKRGQLVWVPISIMTIQHLRMSAFNRGHIIRSARLLYPWGNESEAWTPSVRGLHLRDLSDPVASAPSSMAWAPVGISLT